MEEQEDKTIGTKFSRKLDYYAPLLSTRRPSGSASSAAPPLAAPVVPFSWEQTPGKPKDLETTDSTHDMGVPPPKLPPCRWHQTKESAMEDTVDQCLDDGCDGDIDDGDGGDDGDDIFSDAVDVFSLAETTDMLEALDNASALASGVHSPSFIIQRFLTDANELAASSASSNIDLSKDMNKKHPHYSSNCHNRFVSQAVRQSHSSLQGCGLDTFFFPWRMKHRPCGLKSPAVRQPSLNAKPQCSARRKPKH